MNNILKQYLIYFFLVSEMGWGWWWWLGGGEESEYI